jgi:hypothetical protein
MIPAERRQPEEFGGPFDAHGKVLLADEFLGEEVHEQAIMEGAVRAELVASHHTDRPEADLLVRADGRDIVGSRIDDEPVVAQIIDEVAGQRTDRVASQTLARLGRIEVDIDSGVPVHRVVLLIPLDRANDPAVVLDRERPRQVVGHRRGEVLLLAPPATYLSGGADGDQHRHVFGGRWAERDRGSMKSFHHPMTLSALRRIRLVPAAA